MKKVFDIIVKRLEDKMNELKEKQEYFLIICNNEISSSCFERNAINDLIVMQQLKSEIEELEYIVSMYKIQAKKEMERLKDWNGSKGK